MTESGSASDIKVQLFSFGYKYGFVDTANMIFDVRFLPNPYWEEELRPLSGLNKEISDYVIQSERGRKFIASLLPLIHTVLKGSIESNKESIVIGVGCTGGYHRSVSVVEYIAVEMRKNGFNPEVEHKELRRDRANE